MSLLNKCLEELSEQRIALETVEKFYIYALWRDDEIVYIGQTINIGRRIDAHKNDKDFDEYSYLQCRDQLELDHLESYLIGSLDPEYNKTTGHGMMSLQRVRKKIQGIGPDYKYSEKYYLKGIREIAYKLNISMVKHKSITYVCDMDAEKIIRYAERSGCN